MYSIAYSPAQSVASEPLGRSPTRYDISTKLLGTRSPRIARDYDSIPKQPLNFSTFPSLHTARPCLICGQPTKRCVVKRGNRNGHGNRPYYKCQPCDKFHSWGDNKGVKDSNLECYCNRPSRREVTRKRGRPEEYYECATGLCMFYEWESSQPSHFGDLHSEAS